MKKIFRKKIFAFFLSALLVLALSLPVFADMGPKPSVTLKLYYTPGQRYAVTLLGNTRASGPWGAGGAGVLRGSLCLQPVSALAGGQKASPHPLCADRQSPFLRHRAGIEHPLHQHADPADRACLSGAVVCRAVALSEAAESAKCTIKRKKFVKNQSCCAPGNPL